MNDKRLLKIKKACFSLAAAVLAAAGIAAGGGTGLKSYGQSVEKEVSAAADQIYDNDAWICGNDKTMWTRSIYGLEQRANTFKARKFKMSGAKTTQVLNVKEDTSIEVEYKATVTGGKWKLVLIGPDNHVTVLKEGGGTYKKGVLLKKGRSRFKLVGKNAEVKDLSITFGKADKKVLDYRFRDTLTEQAFLYVREIKGGRKLEIKELEKWKVFMDSRDLKYCIKLLIKQKELSLEALQTYAPFLDEKDLISCMRLLTKQRNGDLTLKALKGLAPFLEEDTVADFLSALIDRGGLKNFSGMTDLLPFMDSDDIRKCIIKARKKGMKLTKSDLMVLSIFMDGDDFRKLL